MTRTTLQINFSELETLRVECPDCGTSSDLPLAKLTQAGLVCSCCGVGLRNFDNNQNLIEFARCFQALQKGKPKFSFVIPVETE